MRIFCLLLLVLGLTACSPRPEYCGLNPYETTSWLACAGAKVSFKGELTAPERITQHPVLAPPPGPLIAGEYNHQTYLDVGRDTQVILLTEERIRCTHTMQTSGYLLHIAQGGAPGTKNSYQGWAVRVLDYECKDA
ncbi:MAG: hypothetical protein AAF512_25930 [Pseudomonadota bacterium]